VSTVRPTFLSPCLPILARVPPNGPGWVHQAKLDGYRFLIAKHGDRVRFFSKRGAEWTDRLAALVETFAALRTDFVLDGELCLCDDRGRPNFRAFHAEMRQGRPDTSRMCYFAFDLLFADVDLRPLPLSERQRDLVRLCNKGRKAVPCLRLVESFPEGPPLLECCAHYQLEGIVSKKLNSPYTSGTSRSWVKVKCDGWRVANEFRHKMFGGRKKPSELTERDRALVRKREELARVHERLREADLRQAVAREIRKHVAILEAEIAELERLS
jgi:bifunctional non-homologous end joining protein LigD